jgi:hypothetical protein
MELKHNFKLILPTGYQNKNNKNLRRCISLHPYIVQILWAFLKMEELMIPWRKSAV